MSGVLLLVLVGYFTNKSLRMIVDLALHSSKLYDKGVWTYNDLLALPYGKKYGANLVLVSMFVAAYGAMVAYLLIIKDTVPIVLGLVQDGDASVGSFVERELVMLLTSLVVCVPLSMQRDFSSLAYTSSISVVADMLLVVFIAVYAPISTSLEENGGFGSVLHNSILNSGFFIGFGVLTVAMCCQHSAFIVAGSLTNPTPSRWSYVTSISLSMSTICCLVLGITGYLGFLDDTSGDVLNNFGVGIEPNIARGLLAITMFFTYPMEAFVARHVLVELLWDGDIDGCITTDESTSTVTGSTTSIDNPNNDGNEVSSLPPKSIKTKICGVLNRRHQVTFLIYILTLIPALIIEDLGPVLSITGAIGGKFKYLKPNNYFSLTIEQYLVTRLIYLFLVSTNRFFFRLILIGCCLAYIIPGLAYLGIHGEDFLQRLANRILSLNTTTSSSTTTNSTELPIDGDATAQIDTTTAANNVDPNVLFSKDYMKGYKKPWWWYPLCMPIWIKIAIKGSTGLNERLMQMDFYNHRQQHSPANNNENVPPTTASGVDVLAALPPTPLDHSLGGSGSESSIIIVEPCIVDYGFAMFFIVFGCIALVAGVASNVYVQVHGIMFDE